MSKTCHTLFSHQERTKGKIFTKRLPKTSTDLCFLFIAELSGNLYRNFGSDKHINVLPFLILVSPRMYDPKNHVGKYSSNELQKLQDLRRQYGNDWQKIGQALGRSAASIKDRCRHLKEDCNTGA